MMAMASDILRAQNGGEGRGRLVRKRPRNGRKAKIGRWRREEGVASQKDGMKTFEGGVTGDGEG